MKDERSSIIPNEIGKKKEGAGVLYQFQANSKG